MALHLRIPTLFMRISALVRYMSGSCAAIMTASVLPWLAMLKRIEVSSAKPVPCLQTTSFDEL